MARLVQANDTQIRNTDYFYLHGIVFLILTYTQGNSRQRSLVKGNVERIENSGKEKCAAIKVWS